MIKLFVVATNRMHLDIGETPSINRIIDKDTFIVTDIPNDIFIKIKKIVEHFADDFPVTIIKKGKKKYRIESVNLSSGGTYKNSDGNVVAAPPREDDDYSCGGGDSDHYIQIFPD